MEKTINRIVRDLDKTIKELTIINSHFKEVIGCPLTYNEIAELVQLIISINESDLLSKLDEKQLTSLKEQINYFNRNISSYFNDMCKDIYAIIIENNEANKEKSIEEMSKEELLAYIKKNNLQ